MVAATVSCSRDMKQILLYNRIKVMRKELIETGCKLGFSHALTIMISQELDLLIYEAQKLEH